MKQYSEERKSSTGAEDAAAAEYARGAARPRDGHPEGHVVHLGQAKYRQASGVSIPAHDRSPERFQRGRQVCGGAGDSGSE
jgi:hypothetical protein